MQKVKMRRNITEVKDDFEINDKKIDRGLLYNGNYNLISNTRVLKDKQKCAQPLAAAILGLNNTRIPLPDDLEFHDSWTDADAQESYLSIEPKCYLILGKPGLGNYSLGESLSKKYNCIHLCPKNLIIDEMEQKSVTGRCIDFNMRHNKVCNFDVILSILKRKLQSASIKHRGFVISGFPLVTSVRETTYKISTLISEESLLFAEDVLYDLIYNLKRKKEKAKKRTSRSSVSSDEVHMEEEAEEEQEQEQEHEDETEENEIVELPKFLLDTCTDIVFSTKTCYRILKSVLLQQIQTLFDFKPDIVIHISCPNSDAVTKRSRKYINYMTSSKTYHSFPINTETEIRWPANYVVSDYRRPFDTHVFNPKYNCQQPTNFRENVVNQICNFKDHIFSYLECKLKDFDSKSVIKLDGRTSVHQMMHHTMERLFMLPIKSTIIPEPLYLEDPPEDIDDFWKTVEELNVIRSGNINFNRYASSWYNRCPVELKKRRTIQGKPKFGVILFKHVYLLSSLDAMILFCRNPRPYLKLHYLEPTCRIITTGTKTSGKTLIAKCLSWLFDAPIICYTQFLKDQKQNKYFNYSKTILSEIIATIEDKRLAKWERAELERISNLNTWFNTVSSILNSYIPLLKKKMYQIEEENIEEDVAFTNKYTTIRNQLSFLPMLDDLEECLNTQKNKNILSFAPLDLITEINKPSIPVLGDPDVTEEISAYILANDLQKEIEPTVEELMTEIIKMLDSLDEQSLESFGVYGKFIIDDFPSNPEYWEFLSDRKLLPDYTIALIENREIDVELIHHYENIENSEKNYQERYLLATDTLIKTKLLNTGVVDTTLHDIQIIVDNITTCALYSEPVKQTLDTNEKNYTEIVQSFTESIEKFREDWESIKLKLDDNLKSFVEVEIEEKTDVQIVDEVLLKIRKSYCKPCIPNEDEEADNEDTDDDTVKNLLTYNDSRNHNETNIYCPIAFYDYGVLWEGKKEFSIKCDNKFYYFCKEETFEKFQKDATIYQFFDMPTKNIPAKRICVIGCTGSGKTSVAKRVAKELGLIHVDFADFINNYLVPKHFKKVGWQYENSFTDTPIDEEVTEFQLDEENLNLVSDILSNEQELRRMINNYFEHGVPLVSILMQKLIQTLWFKNPFQYTGIVIDGYPKLPADVEDMLSCFCIPDLVIDLESNSDTTLERLSSKYFKNWKMQFNVAKIKAGIKLQKEQTEWMNFITKNIVVKLTVDDVLANMFTETAEPLISISAQSTIFDAHPSGSSNVDANLFATFNEFIQEYPEPIDQNEWEKADDVLEKINARLESLFETDDENIQTVKDSLLDQKIKVISVDGKKTFEKVFRKVLLKLSNLRNRGDSFLEQTFVVNCDIAEMLLLEGFFFISKFYRMCPVFILENPCSVSNLYNINKRQSNIFPVIHRSYVYFMSSEINVIKFRTNPLKYIINDAIKEYRQYPLRIGIVGPPKSGKSKLASKLAKRYGLMCVSKGMALRYVLENMLWTDIGSKIVSKLRKGECVDNELITEAVLIVLMDHRIMTHGFVLDGLPDTPFEACELMKDGIFPLIVFDLNSDLVTILKNSQSEIHYDMLKTKPPYPLPFIEYRYSSWQATFRNIRDWFHEDTQNIHYLNGNNSKWQCFLDAYKVVDSLIPKIHYYLTNVDSKIVSVDIFGISNESFRERMSVFQNLCPVCLRKNIFRNSGFPPDKKGVVQYKNLFFWICTDHLSYVLKYPENVLEIKNIKVPDLPVVVKHVESSLLCENGTCLVTYAENLPRQIIVKGKNKFAASYKGKMYLFCSDKCLDKFLSQPHMYFDITVFKEMQIFPKLSLKQLPNLGYLEQTVGNIMTEACCAVNVLRPKYPGLDGRLSALLYVALYLKTHNPLIDKSVLSLYKRALRIFEIRSKMIVDIGLRLRSMDNPFAAYPKCCVKKRAKSITYLSGRNSSSIVSTSLSEISEFNKRD